jgi:phospholipase C
MSTPNITNVFVLMLENHSFDNLFGLSGIPGINGLTGEMHNNYNNDSYVSFSPAVDPMTTDPAHEFLDTLEQLCGEGTHSYVAGDPYPAMNNSGFVANYATSTTAKTSIPTTDHIGDIMSSCNASQQIPNLYSLATSFVLCDNWFSSMPGPTWPNRLFAMGASSNGMDDSPSDTRIKWWETFGGFVYPNGSIFQLLTKNKLSYRLYNDANNMFAANPSGVTGGGGFPIVAGLKGINVSKVHSFNVFEKDVQGKSYPYQFTWIEPNYGNAANNTYSGGSSQHPMDSLAAGDAMVGAAYNAIRNSPIWETSLLVIAYDEHGGFYDHVTPGPAVNPGDYKDLNLNTQGYDFTTYGVRVPAVLVSPLLPKGYVDHTLYDHTSILKTVEDIFALDYLTARDTNANSFNHLFSNPQARTDAPESLDASPPSAAKGVAGQPTVAGETPLPESGNIIGFLQIALKADVDLSDGSDSATQAAVARAQQVKTVGDAEGYFSEISAKVTAAQASEGDADEQ